MVSFNGAIGRRRKKMILENYVDADHSIPLEMVAMF